MNSNDFIVTKHKDLIVKLAAIWGACIGGLIPVGIFSVAHEAVDFSQPFSEQPLLILVAGGLLFSAPTVWCWAFAAFHGGVVLKRTKATGFVLLVEGMMTFVPNNLEWLSITSLTMLVSINAVSAGHSFMMRAEKVFRKSNPKKSGSKKSTKSGSKKKAPVRATAANGMTLV